MNKTGLILLVSLAAVGTAYAQDKGGTTVSTDPAKVAAVEKHAQELQARQSKEATSTAAATHSSTQKSKAKKKPATHKSSTPKPATAQKS
jgi:cytochrome bd-type quinol oxidase subunit 1